MKKIMFNDKYGLTKAVLEGRKTQKRSIVPESTLRKANLMVKVCGGSIENKIIEQAPYCFSEEIAVAQAYKDIPSISDTNYVGVDWERANKNKPFGMWGCANKLPGWDNKMFVRADIMPHRIKITNIRIERLQDISDEDCLKEGIKRKNNRYCVENYKGVCFYTNDLKLAIRCLINKTCGKGTWEKNPYVFVYDFELVK